MSRCARCEAAEIFTEAADVLDPQNSAQLCLACAQDWLRQAVTFSGSDLRVFLGTATPEQRAAHADGLADHKSVLAREAVALAKREVQASEAEARAAQGGRQSRKGTAGGAEERRRGHAAKRAARVRATGEAAAQRPAAIARLVSAGPMTMTEVAAGLGVSRRTATRAIADARKQGLVVVGSGRNAKVHAAEEAQRPHAA